MGSEIELLSLGLGTSPERLGMSCPVLAVKCALLSRRFEAMKTKKGELLRRLDYLALEIFRVFWSAWNKELGPNRASVNTK